MTRTVIATLTYPPYRYGMARPITLPTLAVRRAEDSESAA